MEIITSIMKIYNFYIILDNLYLFKYNLVIYQIKERVYRLEFTNNIIKILTKYK